MPKLCPNITFPHQQDSFPIRSVTTSSTARFSHENLVEKFKIFVQDFVPIRTTLTVQMFLKKSQNASRPSEHPPVRGGEMSKRLGGIKGCKHKTSSWHLNGFLDGNNFGSTVCCRGEAHRYTVHLH